MEVRCERCRAQYVFSDEQVGEQGLTVRCSNCGHLFKVKKKALVVTLPVNDEAGAGAVSAADAQRAAAVQAAAQAVKAEAERTGWTLRQPSGQTYSFRDMTTLHRWIVERKAHREDEISRGNEPWRRLGAISELQSFFAVVEAAERAARPPSPAAPTQRTVAQFPAVVFPGPGAQPPPARTDQAFPPPPPAPIAPPRTEVAFPAQKAPAPPRTEVAFPAQKAPASPRTEVAFPAQKAPPQPVTTEAAFPAQAAAGRAESPLANLFTPEPFVPPRDDPFAAANAAGAAGDTRPDLGLPNTVDGLPPPPSPAAAPLRATAAWEGEARVVPSGAPRAEPAWTSADQQTGGTFVDKERTPAEKAGSRAPALAVAAVVLLAAGGAGWWFFLRQEQGPVAVAPSPEPAARPKPPEPAPPPAAPPEQKPVEQKLAAAEAAPPPAEKGPSAAEKAPAPAAAEKAPAPVENPAPSAEKAPPRAEAKATAETPAPPEEKAPPKKPAPAEPKGAKALVAQAKRALDKGNAKQALDLYGKAVALEPKNVNALAGRGWSYLELSQYAPAEASFQAALEEDGESPSALLGLAETYRYEGRRADAVTYYERYLAASPDGEDAVAAQNAIKSLKE